MLMVNVVGTYAVSKAFLPLLRNGTKKVIVNISSDAGCHAQNASFIHSKKPSEGGVGLSYRTSKAALNMGKCPDSRCSMSQWHVLGYISTSVSHCDIAMQQAVCHTKLPCRAHPRCKLSVV